MNIWYEFIGFKHCIDFLFLEISIWTRVLRLLKWKANILIDIPDNVNISYLTMEISIFLRHNTKEIAYSLMKDSLHVNSYVWWLDKNIKKVKERRKYKWIIKQNVILTRHLHFKN